MSAAALIFPFPKGAKGVAPQSAWSQDQGVDISAPAGTPELAIGSGKIVQEGISGFGPWAPIEQLDTPIGNNRFVYYGHAGPDLVPVGAHVNAGQPITEVGAGIVGISTGPHLEIGLSPTIGIPARGQTSQTTLDFLKGAQTVQAGKLPPGYSNTTPGSVGSTITQLPNAAAGAVGSAVASVFSGFFGWIKAGLLKGALYAVLVAGGAALTVYGLVHFLAPTGAGAGAMKHLRRGAEAAAVA